MSAAARPRAAAPEVDEGDTSLRLQLLLRELAPTPGRLRNTMRLVAVVCLLVTMCELFRIPEPAVAGFIAIFISKEDAATTIQGALVVGLFAALGIGLGILCFMLTLSEPALRIGVLAALTFFAMFLSCASTLGVGFFLMGFLAAFGLTYGDQLQLMGLQANSASDTPEGSLPALIFMPPEEALLHTLLWLILVAVMPAAVVAVVNGLTGQDPAVLLRRGLATRLKALADACAGAPGADRRLAAMALEGTAVLGRQAMLSAKFRRVTPRRRADAALVEPVGRLVVVVLARIRMRSDGRDPGLVARDGAEGDLLLMTLAPVLESWRRAVIEGGGPIAAVPATGAAIMAGTPRAARAVAEGSAAAEAPIVHGPQMNVVAPDPMLPPLAMEITETMRRVGEAFRLRDTGIAMEAERRERKPFSLMKPDAFTNPDYPRFGFKIMLAALICYISYTGANWSQIHTAMVTCFFVPQETLGQTLHKAMLRICGCLCGLALGIGTILLLMPAMTDIGQLLLVIGAVTFVGGWISNGSARTSYAGLQLAFAFFLIILQGFGPTLDMQTGRDRAIGILFGITVASAVFATIWPVRVATVVRGKLAGALEILAAQVERVGQPPTLRPFFQAVADVRELMAQDAFEQPLKRRGDAGAIDARLLTELQALVVPLAIVLRLARMPATDGEPAAGMPDAIVSYHRALAAWLRDSAGRVREQAPAALFAQTLPAAPLLPVNGDTASQAAWYARLDQDMRRLLGRLVAANTEPEMSVPGMSLNGGEHAKA